jgi:hypothetical protein
MERRQFNRRTGYASRLAAIIVGTLAASGAYAQSSDSLKLDLQVDEISGLEDQPIQIVVCVTNMGRNSFLDLASLRPEDGHLSLILRREGQTQPVPMGGIVISSVLTAPGPSLAPRGSECEVLSLLDHFGTWKRAGHELSWAIGQMSLRPGHYMLSAEYRARNGYVKNLKQYLARSGSVEFEVKARGTFPEEESLLTRFLDDGGAINPNDVAGLRERSRRWLPQFLGSRYFFLIYYGTGLSVPSMPSDSILAGLRSNGVGAVREAAFIGLRCDVEPMEGDAKLAWMARVRKGTNNELAQKVIDTWERRAMVKDHGR